MAADRNQVEQLAASIHRGVLGSLLAVLGLVGLGYTRGLAAGDPVIGTVGLVVAVGSGAWICSLFLDGLAQR